MTQLREACQDLASWLAIAETLAAIPDIQPSARAGGRPGTRMPGNVAALHAIMDAHAGVRELEVGFRMRVTGVLRERGGSDGNTMVALEALPDLAGAVDVRHQQETDAKGRRKPCHCDHCDALRLVARWALAIQQLPAVDTAPRWIPIRSGPDGLPPRCPWCETFSLRVSVEYGEIRCVFPGCTDDDGNRPQAQLEVSRVNGQVVLAWKSGLVT